MSPTEQSQRARVVEAAKSWLSTPYHHRAMIKGAGIDCATLLVAAFREAGFLAELVLPDYQAAWHIHRDEEKYTNFIRQFGDEVTGRDPLPGDVVVWKFHRCFSHGAIVVEWPTIIHALTGVGCIIDDALKNQMLAFVSERTPTQGQPRPMKIFSYWRTG